MHGFPAKTRPNRSAWIVVLALLGTEASAQTSRPGGPNRLAPRIRTDLAEVIEVAEGQDFSFRVEARDPEDARVSLTLLNPPPGLVFDPVRKGRSPVSVTARWNVSPDTVGPITLVFEARDELGLRTRLERVVETRTRGRSGVLTGDVTGDGLLDVVAVAARADHAGVEDTGAIYVWAGARSPSGAPTAILSVPGAFLRDGLGSTALVTGQPVKLADVTGDGIADVVALAATARVDGVRDGAIYVFAGGDDLAGAVMPRATLMAPNARILGHATGDGLLCRDVTGDGVLDVVAAAKIAVVGGVQAAGAIYFYSGGEELAGTRGPQAILSIPGAELGDLLCQTDGQGLLIGDVTGDGAADVVAGTQLADSATSGEVGILAVWAGGGVPAAAPQALLTVPGARGVNHLGSQRGHQAVRLADVTDDGILDLVVGAHEADVAGVKDAGAIFVYEGGPALTGTVVPRARLRSPNPGLHDYFGPDRSDGFRIADVTGDGLLEVIAVSPAANVNGVNDAGALFVFHVGPRTGPEPLPDPAPLATLAVPGAVAGDRLAGSTRGLYVFDVTGDGILDLVTVSLSPVGGMSDAGAIHVFAGGAFAGPSAPVATLTVPGVQASDHVGVFGLRFADVTRDGTIDVLASSGDVDVGGARDAGTIHVFAGDGGLSGVRVPFASLTVGGAGIDDHFQLVEVADVTGDGVTDLAAEARSDIDGLYNTGAIYVFPGPLAPDAEPATLVAPAMADLENLSSRRLVDVTGDGVLDVLAFASTSGLVHNAGTILVYPGAPMQGRVLPAAVLASPIALAGDAMQLAAVADVTGDGVPDVIGHSWGADPAGIPNAGALYLFPGGTGGAPATVLAVSGARMDDRLGFGF